jgi:hypothetical protein
VDLTDFRFAGSGDSSHSLGSGQQSGSVLGRGDPVASFAEEAEPVRRELLGPCAADWPLDVAPVKPGAPSALGALLPLPGTRSVALRESPVARSKQLPIALASLSAAEDALR